MGQEGVEVDQKRRDRRIQEVNKLKEKVDAYFKKCFGRNVIEVFNTKIAWGSAEFFIKLAIEHGSIEEHALKTINRELRGVSQANSLEVTRLSKYYPLSLLIQVEIEFPTPHYMFSKICKRRHT